MNGSVWELFNHAWFWSAFCSWFLAQGIKIAIDLYHGLPFDFRRLVSTGGMPSAHSATVCGLTASIGLTEGFGAPVFSVSLAFTILTMFDASTVRRASGQQARLLNEMVREFFKEHRFSETKLAELLGHTRLEVFVGMLLGIFMALLIVSLFV